MKAAGDAGDTGDPRDPRDPQDPRDLRDARELKKEDGMLGDEADIGRFSALDRVEAEAEAKERSAEEVSSDIRSSMKAERLERERGAF